MNYDVCIIGGGPAGMAAAIAAYENGSSVAIIERDVRLGGILNQCIHNGFGLHYFNEELTGPEYANRFINKINELKIDVFCESMVVNISDDKIVTAVSPKNGMFTICAKSIVMTMGCRERSAGAINLCGARCAGIYTAGMAQKLCNIDGYLVGKEVVILGSGDIGLIMARRMTYEGAKVKAVIELMPYSSGLKRNIVQCLNDYNIPLYLAHTITKVVGDKRVEGVYFAPVGADRQPDLTHEQFIKCDTLLLSVGLIPENDLITNSDIKFSPITQGALVDEYRQTTKQGFFAAGNTLHVHDLVDNVSAEGAVAGKSASDFAKGNIINGNIFNVATSGGVRYALPQRVHEGVGEVVFYLRVDNTYKNVKLVARSGDTTLYSKKFMVLTPGEMEKITIDKSLIKADVTISLEA